MDLRYDSGRNLFNSGYLPHAVGGAYIPARSESKMCHNFPTSCRPHPRIGANDPAHQRNGWRVVQYSGPINHSSTVDGQSVIMLYLPRHKRAKIREVVMSTRGIRNCLPYGMACTECNDLLVAPKWSAYVSKHEVRHFWSCENCGHEIEMTVNPHITPH
jgi:hypothetical protein